ELRSGFAEIIKHLTTLGEQWNTRIIIQPQKQRVTNGIYKFLKHPNYIAVVLELAAVPLIFNAWRTAAVYGLINAAVLLLIRIPAENTALLNLSNIKQDGSMKDNK
ncbi:MAG: hypothetical protein JNL32_14925, partial [Candidatus Kapabacteria bacterium]|nr:hypothetical protein [Candidatus Kapabacteria bacterium]